MFVHFAVAIYGKTYCEAATATWQLIKSRGIGGHSAHPTDIQLFLLFADAIINDDLTGSVLFMGALIGAIATTLVLMPTRQR